MHEACPRLGLQTLVIVHSAFSSSRVTVHDGFHLAQFIITRLMLLQDQRRPAPLILLLHLVPLKTANQPLQPFHAEQKEAHSHVKQGVELVPNVAQSEELGHFYAGHDVYLFVNGLVVEGHGAREEFVVVF